MDVNETIFGILMVIMVTIVIFLFGCLIVGLSKDPDANSVLSTTNVINSAAGINEDSFGSLSDGFKGLGIKLEGPLQMNMDGTIGISLFDL